MNYLEIIELRTTSKDRGKVDRFLGDWLDKTRADEKQCQIKVYHHAFVETDISIHLFYKSGAESIVFSPIGSQLAIALKDFGLVNYNIWLRQKRELD